MIVDPTSVTLKDGTAITLRSPTGADAAAVLAYARGLMAESSRNMNHFADGFDGVTEEAEAAILGGFAQAPRGFMISAFRPDGTVVGNIGVTVDPRGRLAHVGTIGMGALQAVHGKGVGMALMRAAIAAADASGVWNLKLTVRTFNAPAIALYEKCGFERIGTLKAIASVDDGFADEHVYQRLGARPRT